MANADHSLRGHPNDQRRRYLPAGDGRPRGVADDFHQIRRGVVDLDAGLVAGVVHHLGHVVEVGAGGDANANRREAPSAKATVSRAFETFSRALDSIEETFARGGPQRPRRCRPARRRVRATRAPVPAGRSGRWSRDRTRFPRGVPRRRRSRRLPSPESAGSRVHSTILSSFRRDQSFPGLDAGLARFRHGCHGFGAGPPPSPSAVENDLCSRDDGANRDAGR